MHEEEGPAMALTKRTSCGRRNEACRFAHEARRRLAAAPPRAEGGEPIPDSHGASPGLRRPASARPRRRRASIPPCTQACDRVVRRFDAPRAFETRSEGAAPRRARDRGRRCRAPRHAPRPNPAPQALGLRNRGGSLRGVNRLSSEDGVGDAVVAPVFLASAARTAGWRRERHSQARLPRAPAAQERPSPASSSAGASAASRGASASRGPSAGRPGLPLVARRR